MTSFRRILVTIAAIIVAGGAITSVLLFLSSRSVSVPSPTPMPFTPVADAPVPSLSPSPTSPSRSMLPTSVPRARASSDDEHVVALVNGAVLTSTDLQRMTAIDRVMADLTDTDITGDVLSRLINQTLVLQKAREANFTLSESQIDAALNAFLRRYGLRLQDLDQALAKQNISMAEFRDYFADLITVSRFVEQQSRAVHLAADAYVTQLQATAHISFGPAARNAALSTPSPHPVTPSPAPPTAATPPSPLALPTGPTTPSPLPRGLRPGQVPPDFTLTTLRGETLSLQSLLGKPVVLSFFTTWCPYCRRQTPILVNAHSTYKEDIHFVGIDVREKKTVVDDYVRKTHIAYPVLLDDAGRVAAAYRVNGFPITYFLDEQGRVVAKHVGALTSDTLRRYLQKLLEERTQTP